MAITNKMGTRSKRAGFLLTFRAVLSYLWPIRLAQTGRGSDYVELIQYKGIIQLNSQNANYSYGNLQLAFKHLFDEEDLPWNSLHRVLILGFGLGGVIDLIEERCPGADYVAVENDEQVVRWHFQFFKRDRLQLVVEDASHAIGLIQETFDLIIVDVYKDLEVPPELESEALIKRLYGILNSSGVIIFNKVVGNPRQQDQYTQLLSIFSGTFSKIRTNHQMNINRFILGFKT